ncbi:MAG TPA: prepilin-type N-terminal cleavage/methylation domain-containing protein, partial [Sumerlaeia bacterium]|nr:prepilin-type N-terminal cleavage/methylation domain-containing protein [Sumerlaeia bacterium]
FTLIELLIVVAIIAILAAIAVPNFLEAQVRSRVSRMRADMRSLTAALESYMTDNGGYIWSAHNNSHYGFRYPAVQGQDMFHWYSRLTTPIAYISSIPRDVFSVPNTGVKGQQYILHYAGCLTGQYEIGAPRSIYVLVSVGPDLVNDVFNMQGQSGVDYIIDDTHWDPTTGLLYDPTNGSNSWGDVYRFSTGEPFLYNSTYPGGEPMQFLRYER